MGKTIEMYWWNDQPNLGDRLNPLIVERLFGVRVRRVEMERATLIGIGSCLHRLARSIAARPRDIHVWGTGYPFDEEPAVGHACVRHWAIRGKLTQRHSALDGVTLGDPGLLACHLVDAPRKDAPVGLVPHLWNRADAEVLKAKERFPWLKVIDVRRHPVEVMKQIASCEVVLSSALHGLVIADSFGVPNQWVTFTTPPHGGEWKFRDYYSVYDMPPPAPRPFRADLLEQAQLEQVAAAYRPRDTARIQRSLVRAFPRDHV
ncbi:polysaccharide pyruvyl transferase family protein [Streptomyces sp. NPDC049555]|uniref:polysaccharide pyruvyl transferase family protein n=1 Tax=unclassified Streptomyces TaxID=2593676 RepID=UPI00341D42F0